MENSSEQVGGPSNDDFTPTPGSEPAGGTSQGLKEQAISKAQSLLDTARTNAQDKAKAAITTRKNATIQALTGISQSLSSAGQQLRDQQNDASGIIDRAAGQLDRAAQYLETAEVEDLVQATESWARRNPALFIGGAFVVGLLGARFLKASRPASLPVRRSVSADFSDREVQTMAVRGDL